VNSVCCATALLQVLQALLALFHCCRSQDVALPVCSSLACVAPPDAPRDLAAAA
jgi:hypothetical protein